MSSSVVGDSGADKHDTGQCGQLRTTAWCQHVQNKAAAVVADINPCPSIARMHSATPLVAGGGV